MIKDKNSIGIKTKGCKATLIFYKVYLTTCGEYFQGLVFPIIPRTFQVYAGLRQISIQSPNFLIHMKEMP